MALHPRELAPRIENHGLQLRRGSDGQGEDERARVFEGHPVGTALHLGESITSSSSEGEDGMVGC